MNEQQLKQAENHYRTELKKNENDLQAFLKYLSIQVVKGDLIKARKLMVNFLTKHATRTDVINKLVPIAVQEEQYETALKVYEVYQQNNPAKVSEDVILAVGYANEKLKRLETAIGIYRSLTNNDKAKMALAHALRYSGKTEQAIDSYEDIISAQSIFTANAYWSLSNLKSYDFTEEQIRAMLDWLAVNKQNKERYFIEFALGYAFEKKGEFDQSYNHYKTANQLRAGQYNIFKHKEFTKKLIENFSKVNLADTRSRSNLPFVPVFIVGMPRSGSTLVEQILSSHSQVERLGELPYINQLLWEFEKETGSNYPDNLTQLTPHLRSKYRQKYIELTQAHLNSQPKYITDKNPNNFEHVGFIKAIFPEAKIIDTRRDFRANAFSLFRQLFIRGQEYSYSFTTIKEYYEDYLTLMVLWKNKYGDDLKLVQYEELVNNLADNVNGLLRFLDLEFESACLEFYKTKQSVDTASSEQVRKPIYKAALEQWKNYEKYLPQFILEA